VILHWRQQFLLFNFMLPAVTVAAGARISLFNYEPISFWFFVWVLDLAFPAQHVQTVFVLTSLPAEISKSYAIKTQNIRTII
jgi:hypothetical protein